VQAIYPSALGRSIAKSTQIPGYGRFNRPAWAGQPPDSLGGDRTLAAHRWSKEEAGEKRVVAAVVGRAAITSAFWGDYCGRGGRRGEGASMAEEGATEEEVATTKEARCGRCRGGQLWLQGKMTVAG
ncbi:hypothetical protein BHE74_00018862, partial [Ensete ventricosum]